MKARPTLADLSPLSPRHQAEVIRQLASKKPIGIARAEFVRAEVATKPRIRQSHAPKLNKTEAAFALWLREHKQDAAITEQDVTLKLGNGVRYTPDFIAIDFSPCGSGRILTAYEVKGFMRDDAAVKLKVAASRYPWIHFVLVSRVAGAWHTEAVLP